MYLFEYTLFFNYTLYKKYFVLICSLQVYVKQISRLSSSQGEFATILVTPGYLLQKFGHFYPLQPGYLHFWNGFFLTLACLFAPNFIRFSQCFSVGLMTSHVRQTETLRLHAVATVRQI